MYDHKSLLDRRREGQEFSLADINRALRDAGDLDPDRSERMDKTLSQETPGAGKTGSASMVGKYQDGHKKEAWAGWSRYLDYRNEQETI